MRVWLGQDAEGQSGHHRLGAPLQACLHRQHPVPIKAQQTQPHHPEEPGAVTLEGESPPC